MLSWLNDPRDLTARAREQRARTLTLSTVFVGLREDKPAREHPMGEDDAGNRLRTLVKAVSDDLWIAFATFEVYAPSAFDAALIDKVNEREVYPAVNVVSEALEGTTISHALPHLAQDERRGPHRRDREMPVLETIAKAGSSEPVQGITR
jgi:hypothetical protein